MRVKIIAAGRRGAASIRSAESEHRGVIEEYSRLAAEYDVRWASYIGSSVDECLGHVALTEGVRLLDVGCGTGALLSRVHDERSGVSPTGVEPVPAMLALARQKLGAGAAFCRSWAEALPFREGAFDAVVSCNAFHYVSLPETALQEMLRVLRPGGQLVVTDWCADHFPTRVVGWYLRAAGRALHRVYRERELAALVMDAGFRDARATRKQVGRLWGLVTVTAVK